MLAASDIVQIGEVVVHRVLKVAVDGMVVEDQLMLALPVVEVVIPMV